MAKYIGKSKYVLLFVLCSLVVGTPIAVAEESGNGSDTASSNAQKSEPEKLSELAKLPVSQVVQQAKVGDIRAEFELGSRLNYGRGMPKNVKEALRWLRRAAEGGQQDAQRLLAVKFYSGFEVPVDFVEAFHWAAQLAEAGDVSAQLSLANMYASGEGVARNLVRSYMWYSIASASAGKKGAPEAVEKAAQEAIVQREKLLGLLLPEQEVEAQQMASEWWLKAAETPVSKSAPAANADAAPKGEH